MRLILPKMRPHQTVLAKERKRFNCWVCHRRFGKTVLCLELLVEAAIKCRLNRGRYAYFAPQRSQAKDIAWLYLQQFTVDVPGVEINQADLMITLPHNGAQIRLYGADNYGLGRSRRGIYLDGVAIDEYADIAPVVWTQVLRPMLVDRQGWAIFIGTPRGKNHFYQLYQQARQRAGWSSALLRADHTGVIPQTELALLRAEAEEEGKLADYEQEFLCSWDTPMPGAVYADQLRKLDQDGRVGYYPYVPEYPVCTGWDIGPVHNAIWYWQQIGTQVRFIDYDEASGDLAKHIASVRAKPYLYDHSQVVPPLTRHAYEVHYGPHDLEDSPDYATPKTRIGVALAEGFRFTVLPRGTLEDRIEAMRRLLTRSVFHEKACEAGLNALRSYRYELDDIKQTYRTVPIHDWASHGADAAGTVAVGLFPPSAPLKPPVPEGSFEFWSRQLKRTRRGKQPETFVAGRT